MKLFRILAIAALAMVSSASAQAGVVLSNMGSSGTDTTNVTTTNTIQTVSVRNSAGFTTGAVGFDLSGFNAIMDSAINPTAVNVTFAVYSNNGGVPGTKIAETASQTVNAKQSYSFSFSSPVSLSASTTYWAVIETGVSSSWYAMNGTAGDPVAQNSSGFSFVSYKQSNNFNATTPTWGGTDANRYAFAVLGTNQNSAVPEPALTSLLCLGGVALIRRRMKK
jgi:hypothetical protein